MAIQKTEKIWHNGKLIAWDDATIHVMSHVVHYGSSVFEGVRCYAPPSGPAIFRAFVDGERAYPTVATICSSPDAPVAESVPVACFPTDAVRL